MAGKRKRTASDDAPRSPLPPPPRWGTGDDYEEESSLSDYSGDSRSDRFYLSDSDDEDYSSSHVPDHVGGGYSNEESEIADLFDFLNLPASSHDSAEAEVQPPPPPHADHPAAAEVSDQSVAAAGTAPEVLLPAAKSVLCFGCEREPASLRLEPVEHACFCLRCRSSGWSYHTACFVTAPAVGDSGEEDSRDAPLAVYPYAE